MRAHELQCANGAIARCVAGKFLEEFGKIVARRGQPCIFRICGGPLVIRIFGEREQVQNVVRHSPVKLVIVLDLRDLVADPQGTHFEFAEVFIGGGCIVHREN